VRISEVIGERVRAQRVEHEWTQTELGQQVGAYLGQEWTRQAISAAEKGKRAFTAAELLTFARVLGVGVTYLLSPLPGTGDIEMAPGVAIEPLAIVEAINSPAGTGSEEEKFVETGMRFFQSIADLSQVLGRLQADMDAFVSGLRAVHAARNHQAADAEEPGS
jgi:transcriptional regulator with XRE-family HTH domain